MKYCFVNYIIRLQHKEDNHRVTGMETREHTYLLLGLLCFLGLCSLVSLFLSHSLFSWVGGLLGNNHVHHVLQLVLCTEPAPLFALKVEHSLGAAPMMLALLLLREGGGFRNNRVCEWVTI